MAQWAPNNLTVKGAISDFHERLQSIPTVYDNHCQKVTSTAPSEQYVWPGAVPVPREFLNMRSIQGMRDFTYTKINQEYELSMLIPRKFWEDDQTGTIALRMKELAEAWGMYKDYLFAALVVLGLTSAAHPYGAYSTSATSYFFDDDNVWNSTGTIDNKLTSAAAAADAVPTGAEHIAQINAIKARMLGFKDDKGRPFNALAVNSLRLLVSPLLEAPSREALHATFLTGVGGSGSQENVHQNMAEFDVCPYLSDGTTTQDWFVSAVGAERKPYIYQERGPFELIMCISPEQVALHNGVLVLCRQRFVFSFGDLRRAAYHQYTT